MERRVTSRVRDILQMRDNEGRPLVEHIRNGKWNSELIRSAAARLELISIEFSSLTEEEYHDLTLMFLVTFFARSRWPYKHDSAETRSLDIFVRNFLNVYDQKAVSGSMS
jgi:hypothetical protein